MNDMLNEDIDEIKTLVSSMNGNLNSVLDLSNKILSKCKSNELNVAHGISFLETKYQLMLNYLINLIYVVFKKSGSKIESDPSISRLIEIRTYLEKIAPIEHKLKYQIEKSIRTAITGEASSNDLTAFRPNIEKLGNNSEQSDDDSDSDGETKVKKQSKKKSSSSSDQKYVPPKLTTAHYDSDDEEPEAKLGKAKRFALHSSIMQDLKEEYLDTPIEISATSRAQQINSKKAKEKEEYEEKYLTRLPITKQEKHRQRRMTTINTLGNELSYSILENDKKPTKKRKAAEGKFKKGGKKRKFH